MLYILYFVHYHISPPVSSYNDDAIIIEDCDDSQIVSNINKLINQLSAEDDKALSCQQMLSDNVVHCVQQMMKKFPKAKKVINSLVGFSLSL